MKIRRAPIAHHRCPVVESYEQMRQTPIHKMNAQHDDIIEKYRSFHKLSLEEALRRLAELGKDQDLREYAAKLLNKVVC